MVQRLLSGLKSGGNIRDMNKIARSNRSVGIIGGAQAPESTKSSSLRFNTEWICEVS
jgi:hypothetical protein